MKSSERPEYDRIELGDSDLANKVELVVNTALSKVIPTWLKVVMVIVLTLQIVGIPTILGTMLVGGFGSSNCPPYYDQPVDGGF